MALRRTLATPLLVTFALLSAAALPAHAASFDCQKASAGIEQAICASKTLSTQDEQLAEHYQQLMTLSPQTGRVALRNAQRDWLKQRNACSSDAATRDACLTQQLTTRDAVLVQLLQQALDAFDAAVVLIPRDPATAARQLRQFGGLQANAWLVYLQQFEAASGLSRQDTLQAQKEADAVLAGQDSFAWSILQDTRKDAKSTPADNALLLLRMSIEQDPYREAGPAGKPRAENHCFVFSRQGDAAYTAFGPLYGSTRDGFAPICAPQGGLFEKAAWKELETQFNAPERAVSSGAGTIRFASFAAWRVLALRATLTPKDFLQTDRPVPTEDAAPQGDGAQRIKDWTDERVWPATQRQQAIAAIDPAVAATVKWLQQERGFSEAEAQTAGKNIVQQWLAEHLDYLSDNSDSE
ncbi:DUF1311 domain-containing protein [Erwinia sp. E602]|uniref:lysozyme inhibitor LprI family protein n=1 Tax=Erwinia sp. E602 TaxID=2675378 RepID=UPI001BA8A66B|nr:lysozyme inhibitor LprI family protein [Erwinia sp. E602]QUG75311.1 DUF1311 domain-containing protein [Erwinia sp. E602]